MQIICAGFPKTGTKSMAKALRELGYTVYDFEEHLEENMDKFNDYFAGYKDSSELMEAYRNIDACTDQPTCTMWLTFFNNYPDAKVILMERDSSEVWYNSYIKMLDYYTEKNVSWFEKNLPLLSHALLPIISPTYTKWLKLAEHCMMRSAAFRDPYWEQKAVSKECWIYQYEMHNAAVKQLVPADQLLVFKTGEGWQNLCKFLGKEVPDTPFPRENVGGTSSNIVDQFLKFDLHTRMKQEVSRSLTIAGIILSLCIGSAVAYINPEFINI